MIINKLDSIEFRLKELHDFTWLKKYGTAFWVVDETGSGCICIGMEDAERKYFCKIQYKSCSKFFLNFLIYIINDN